MNLKLPLSKTTTTRWRRLTMEVLLIRTKIQLSNWLNQSDGWLYRITSVNDLKAPRTRKSADTSQTTWNNGLNLLSSKKNFPCQWVWTGERPIAYKKLIGQPFGSKMPLSRSTMNLTLSKSSALFNLPRLNASLQQDVEAQTLLAIPNWSSLSGPCLSPDFLPSRKKVSIMSLLWRCNRLAKALNNNRRRPLDNNSLRVWSICDQSTQSLKISEVSEAWNNRRVKTTSTTGI